MFLDKNIWSISTPLSDIPFEAKEAYDKVLPYVNDFLYAEHPYRKGVMCPFVPSAIKNDLIFFSYSEKKSIDMCIDVVRNLMEHYLNVRKNNEDKYISFILMFDENFDIANLLDIQHLTKVFCIENNIMIGALYKESNAPSLHNENYFPLRTQVPCLVMRDLTSQDLIFLDPEQYSIEKRIGFLKSFIKRFSTSNKKYDIEQVNKAKEILQTYS